MQWHVHDNLCFNEEGRVRGLTNGEGECRPGLGKPPEPPMIHVWIEAHPGGPFAALEGIGGGRIPRWRRVLCDHAHGAPAERRSAADADVRVAIHPEPDERHPTPPAGDVTDDTWAPAK